MKGEHYSYDVFISHNRADKEWARMLAGKIAAENYNGRALRPWMDEQFLDPGDLKSNAELTTAMDRSRLFGLVLSPESVASFWVNFEIDHFLETRDKSSIVLMMRKTCMLPENLKKMSASILDFRIDERLEEALVKLWAYIKPVHRFNTDIVERGVDTAFQLINDTDPGGFFAEPTHERDLFYNQLCQYQIDDAVVEGFAIVAFNRAATYLNKARPEILYNYKMLLGECLGSALHSSNGYRQVAQHFLSVFEKNSSNTDMLFVVARAYSKLAETDAQKVDLSVLLRAIAQLDSKQILSNEEKSLEILFGRIAGKIRHLSFGELFIKTLTEGGVSSRIVAITAISYNYRQSEPVFYLTQAENNYKNRIPLENPQDAVASRKMLSLLSDLEIDQDERVQDALEIAKEDIRRASPDVDFPYSFFWFNEAAGLTSSNLHNAPFIGSIVKVSLENMNEMAIHTDETNVVCLTEERIVEALFDHCGALLILEQDPESLQCQRLRNREIPFGMMKPEMMTELTDGDQIMVRQDKITLWKNKHR